MLVLLAALALDVTPPEQPGRSPLKPPVVAAPAVTFHRAVSVDGVRVFYREAGPPDAPVVLLLHGFPSSSHMYRDLIPALSDRYRVIAPDLPGFGFSDVPDSTTYAYTFDNFARTIARFTRMLGLEHYALYVFDYGAPVGFRLAMEHPDAITAIISQNGNAYEEGLSDGWAPLQRYWRDPNPSNREALRGILGPDSTRWQYTEGAPDPDVIAPESWTLDQALLDRPGVAEIQLDLFADYRTNVELYPRFQAYFRERRPPLLAIWGRHDPYFLPAGAEAFSRDNPGTEVVLLDTGHFALETHGQVIASRVHDFLDRKVPRP